MRQIMSVTFAVAAVMAMAGSTGPAAAQAMCASDEQRAQVQEFFAANPGALPAVAIRQLRMPEVTIVSALPDEQAAGSSKEAFEDIWASITKWDTATTLVIKDANVFEVHGAIPMGEQSTRSNFYNFSGDAPLSGHFRPDLLSSIYAIDIPGKDGAATRAVMFYNGDGESSYGIFLAAAEGMQPTEAEVAKFNATKDLIKSLPSPCAGV